MPPRESRFDKCRALWQGSGVKVKRIRLYIKPCCGWCDKAVRWLEERHIAYEKIDVMEDETAFDEMIRLSGQEQAPVLEAEGEVLADFGPDQLAEFWGKLERKQARLESR
jgi:glutaredoxin